MACITFFRHLIIHAAWGDKSCEGSMVSSSAFSGQWKRVSSFAAMAALVTAGLYRVAISKRVMGDEINGG